MTALACDRAPLDHADALRSLLGEEAALQLPLIEWVSSVDSSNSALLQRASVLPSRAVLVADTQSAGRGRRGRSWSMLVDGNLALSMFARLAVPVSAIGGLSLALGVACAETLRDVGAHEVGLKWPNDLLARGRKLGGLLVEFASGTPSGVGAVIGLGLNLHLPTDAEPTWIAFDELGIEVERPLLAARLIDALMPALATFEAEGFAAFTTRWQALDVLQGRDVRVLASDAEHHGRVLGVRADGALRVLCERGEQVFLSAEVSVRPL